MNFKTIATKDLTEERQMILFVERLDNISGAFYT